MREPPPIPTRVGPWPVVRAGYDDERDLLYLQVAHRAEEADHEIQGVGWTLRFKGCRLLGISIGHYAARLNNGWGSGTDNLLNVPLAIEVP